MNYLTYNEYRLLWDLVTRKPFLTGFPIHLDVELTSRCNLRCKMCFQQHIQQKRTDMPDEVFKKIVDEGIREGLCSLKLQSRGESLLHKNVVGLLRYAKEKGILDVHITTNGLLLKDNVIDGLIECGLDLLIISYDKEHALASSMTMEKYTQFLQDVIVKVDRKRKEKNKNSMKIRIQTCVKDYTPESIRKYEKKNKALFPEADLVLINPMYVSFEDDPHLPNFDDYELHPCSYLWQRLTIYADGSVTTCSRDYNCKFNRLGNVEVDSIRDIWNSSTLRDMRRRQLDGRRKEFHICAVCENYLIHKKTGLPGAGCTGIVYPMKKRSA